MTGNRTMFPDKRNGLDTRYIETSVNTEGGLAVVSQNFGPGVRELFGVCEYGSE